MRGWDFVYKSVYLFPCKHAEADYLKLLRVASCPPCFFPVSISDLAIPVKVPTLCVSTPGTCCPVHLIGA